MANKDCTIENESIVRNARTNDRPESMQLCCRNANKNVQIDMYEKLMNEDLLEFDF